MIAVIGAGLTGLTAAIRLAETGVQVELFEAAAQPGGRTRSFCEPVINQLCDNGPHLLIGAYSATQKLLEDCGAASNVYWQPTLELPLWNQQRGLFSFQPSHYLPFALALPLAVAGLPGHSISSALAMLRVGRNLQSGKPSDTTTVQGWMEQLRLPPELISDLIEPLCLGAMNEPPESADVSSFQQVLRQSFASHKKARLGWFTQPMSEALIKPLVCRAEELGVNIHTQHLVRSLREEGDNIRVDDQIFDAAILAMPAYASNRLLGRQDIYETRPITNIHLWFEDKIQLPSALIGGIGTEGQWFFDVSRQMAQEGPPYHLCAVISADTRHKPVAGLIDQISAEIQNICGMKKTLSPLHTRIIQEKRATVLVRPKKQPCQSFARLIYACECPVPGELPATIETAVLRGENAARLCKSC